MTRERIASKLARGHNPGGRSDAALEAALGGGPRPGQQVGHTPPMPAAVLVPLVERPEGMTVLLTRRTAHLAHHPGQISFPGGRVEPCDDGDSIACALRETEEEVGLPAGMVTVLGRLDDYVTATNFIVTPVVGVTTPPIELALDAFEVAETFEVPLAFLVDSANYSLERREIDGRPRFFWTIPWEGRAIWGATAGILVNLSEVLRRRGR